MNAQPPVRRVPSPTGLLFMGLDLGTSAIKGVVLDEE